MIVWSLAIMILCLSAFFIFASETAREPFLKFIGYLPGGTPQERKLEARPDEKPVPISPDVSFETFTNSPSLASKMAAMAAAQEARDAQAVNRVILAAVRIDPQLLDAKDLERSASGSFESYNLVAPHALEEIRKVRPDLLTHRTKPSGAAEYRKRVIVSIPGQEKVTPSILEARISKTATGQLVEINNKLPGRRIRVTVVDVDGVRSFLLTPPEQRVVTLRLDLPSGFAEKFTGEKKAEVVDASGEVWIQYSGYVARNHWQALPEETWLFSSPSRPSRVSLPSGYDLLAGNEVAAETFDFAELKKFHPAKQTP
ncbi:MAG: hypothetical protein SFY92_06090 [Verrucomicrobiae bacterium]|nr:hypothetical protein [Verrucomicrobiae bacterium]